MNPIGIFYPRRHPHNTSVYHTEEIGVHKVCKLGDKIVIKMDVELFHPDEINVRTLNNSVIIEGNHGIGEHDNFFHQVTRSFQRTFPLPPNAVLDHLTCNIGPDGWLTVVAPLVQGEDLKGTLHKVTHPFVHVTPSWHETFQLKMECPGVTISKEQVAISLEIPNFRADEVQVKTVSDELIISGSRHDDDEEGVKGVGGTGSCGKIGVKANFTRKYPLPLDSKKDAIYCEFSKNIGRGGPTLRVIVPRVPSVMGDEEIEHVINIV